MALADTAAALEAVAASDPDATVSLAALEALRRARVRRLNAVLAERLTAAAAQGDPAALDRLRNEQERWISLERGTMLPAFLRTPPPVFTATPSDRPVRVVAFGDFGNGSASADGARENARRVPCDPPLRSRYHPRRQLLQRRHGKPVGSAVADAVGTGLRCGSASPSTPRSGTTIGDTRTARRPRSSTPHKRRRGGCRAAYYSFTAGPVQFFALDTQSVALSERQLRWLDTELSRSQARWKVVYGHHPIYSGGNYEDRPDLISKLLPLLRDRVDAYICGHDHNLQALRPDGNVRFYIAGGGGAGLYDLRPYERSVFASRSNGFAVLDADITQMTVSLVDGNGVTIYTDTIKKDPATASGPPR